jgi:hypothetical protein
MLAHGLPIRLLVDGSKVGASHQLLMVAVAYRRRAIPIAWTWVRSARGHSGGWKQLALLAYVRQLVPAQAVVQLAGDCEFGPVPVLQQLDDWKWSYVLRQPGNHLAQLPQQSQWQRLDSLIQRPGQRVWLAGVQLTQAHSYPTNFAAYWQPGATESWLLATNLPDLRPPAYLSPAHWIEEMFGDFKDMGRPGSTPIATFLRLSRLTCRGASVRLVPWPMAPRGQKGQRYRVDPRRAIEYFPHRVG